MQGNCFDHLTAVYAIGDVGESSRPTHGSWREHELFNTSCAPSTAASQPPTARSAAIEEPHKDLDRGLNFTLSFSREDLRACLELIGRVFEGRFAPRSRDWSSVRARDPEVLAVEWRCASRLPDRVLDPDLASWPSGRWGGVPFARQGGLSIR